MLFSLDGMENYYYKIYTMIILRTKQYSKTTKFLAGVKKVADTGLTNFSNAGIKTRNAISQVMTGKAPSMADKMLLKPKTAMQIKRDTIKAVNNVKNAPTNYYVKAQQVAATPVGKVVNNGIKTSIRRPDYAVTAIASEASTPIGMAMGGPVGKVLMAPWGTPAMKVLEKHPLVPKKLAPKLNRVAEKYGKTKMAGALNRDTTTFGDVAMNARNLVPFL